MSQNDGGAANPFKPSVGLLVKLGSIIVHYEELTSPQGHHFDGEAIKSARHDPEVVEWFKGMNKLAMLPVKR